MNRTTRDKFAARTVGLTSGSACWETPPAIYRSLDNQYSFDIDLTADAQNHLCPIWYGPDSPVGDPDALTADWMKWGRRGFSNPPYGPFVPKILCKAKFEATRGFTSVFLLPMRANEGFREHILYGASKLLFCDKRICFYENGKPRLNAKTGKPDSALFDSIIVEYAPCPEHRIEGRQPVVGIWEVPPHV